LAHSHHISSFCRDDKANLLLNLIYSKKSLVQLLYQQRPGEQFNLDGYDKQVKAHMHDPPTAAGYKLVISSHLRMCQGSDAVTEAVASGVSKPVLLWDVSARKHTRDGLLVVYVKGMKFQRSTPYEHTRNMLHHMEAMLGLHWVRARSEPLLSCCPSKLCHTLTNGVHEVQICHWQEDTSCLSNIS
jgi:hypothetical protein